MAEEFSEPEEGVDTTHPYDVSRLVRKAKAVLRAQKLETVPRRETGIRVDNNEPVVFEMDRDYYDAVIKQCTVQEARDLGLVVLEDDDFEDLPDFQTEFDAMVQTAEGMNDGIDGSIVPAKSTQDITFGEIMRIWKGKSAIRS